MTRDKEGHYIMIKGSMQEENITIVNIYAPNIGAPQYIRQTLTDIKGEIDSNTIIIIRAESAESAAVHARGQRCSLFPEQQACQWRARRQLHACRLSGQSRPGLRIPARARPAGAAKLASCARRRAVGLGAQGTAQPQPGRRVHGLSERI